MFPLSNIHGSQNDFPKSKFMFQEYLGANEAPSSQSHTPSSQSHTS